MIKRFLILVSIYGLIWVSWVAFKVTPVQTKVFLSPVYTIDKIYHSMEGPFSMQKVLLQNSPASPELVWMTGFRTEMMQADGTTPSKPEFMCHVNFDFDEEKHRQALGMENMLNSRLLTLSQGELEVTFPKGFGMPILSNEPLMLTTQVLNLNDPNLKTKVRHKVTFNFVRDRDLKRPMKPLFNSRSFITVPLDELPPMSSGMNMKSVPTIHGTSCLPGAPGMQATNKNAPNAIAGIFAKDEHGRALSGHWVVPPGRSEVWSNVTKLMDLPFDTTLHFAAVHLHPYAESLELRDLTTNKTVFKSHVRNLNHRIGLDSVDNYSSEKGTPLFKDHQYELISVYNNPTAIDSDSMAVMLLYLFDKQFKKPIVHPSTSN